MSSVGRQSLPPFHLPYLSQGHLTGTTSVTTLHTRQSRKYRYLLSGHCDTEVAMYSRYQKSKYRAPCYNNVEESGAQTLWSAWPVVDRQQEFN